MVVGVHEWLVRWVHVKVPQASVVELNGWIVPWSVYKLLRKVLLFYKMHSAIYKLRILIICTHQHDIYQLNVVSF